MILLYCVDPFMCRHWVAKPMHPFVNRPWVMRAGAEIQYCRIYVNLVWLDSVTVHSLSSVIALALQPAIRYFVYLI